MEEVGYVASQKRVRQNKNNNNNKKKNKEESNAAGSKAKTSER